MILNLHKVLHLYQTPSKFYIQPVEHQDEAIIIDRQTCEISSNSMFSVSLLPANATSSLIYGIIGIKRLMNCPYLIVITKATQIGTIENAQIFRMDQAKSIPFEPSIDSNRVDLQASEWDAIYVSMLDSVLQTTSFYFSYTYDLTSSLQRRKRLEIDPSITNNPRPCITYDKRFLWNYHLINDFERAGNIADNYRLPLILGFISINKAVLRPGIHWSLISRRGTRRAGTRFNTRGIDRDGDVANFVETEQILEDASGAFLTSFVQVRGSIPLHWTQKTDYRYKPEIEIDTHDNHDSSMRKHFVELKQHYGNISVVSLIDNHGHEAKLAHEFSQRMSSIQAYQTIPYHHFDFHRECSKMRWHNLSILMDALEREIDSYGFFAMDKKEIARLQTGVIRTNCIDSLDRTNVVQSMIAQRVMELQLEFFLRIPAGSRLTNQVGFMQIFKNTWADNADALSIQYAGTPALKTDFTRTGKRTHIGMLKDGMNSMTRYVANTFLDSYRQDAIDLFLGNFEWYPSPRYRPMVVTSYTSPLSITVVVLTLIALYFYLRMGN